MWTIDKVIDELNKLAAADGLSKIDVPITVNGRLTRTLGRVKYMRIGQDAYIAKAIEFSKTLLESGTDNDIINVSIIGIILSMLICGTSPININPIRKLHTKYIIPLIDISPRWLNKQYSI